METKYLLQSFIIISIQNKLIMKILWFSPIQITENGVKGGGNWVYSLSKGVSLYPEIDLYIAFLSKINYIRKEQLGAISIIHVPKDMIFGWKNYLSKYFNLNSDGKVSKRYLKIIQDINPDIIQLFGFEHNYGSILSENINIPVVIHIQSIYQLVYKKWYSGLSKTEIKKYSSFSAKILRNTFYHQYKRNLKKLNNEIVFYKRSRYITGRTKWDRLVSELLAPHAKYFHCNEGLRESFYNHLWTKKKDNKTLNIITTSGASIYKGLETIIETLEALEEYTSYNIIWRVIGLTSNNEIVKICKRKYKKRYSKDIKLLGKLSANEMIKYMNQSDFYVHTSHVENSSNAISEAMLFGMPVISIYTGGNSTLIKDGETGYLIQEGDYLHLAALIKKLCENFEDAKALGKKAREIAIERHNINNIVKTQLKIYQTILYPKKTGLQ